LKDTHVSLSFSLSRIRILWRIYLNPQFLLTAFIFTCSKQLCMFWCISTSLRVSGKTSLLEK
jgi:hypothetical protein